MQSKFREKAVIDDKIMCSMRNLILIAAHYIEKENPSLDECIEFIEEAVERKANESSNSPRGIRQWKEHIQKKESSGGSSLLS